MTWLIYVFPNPVIKIIYIFDIKLIINIFFCMFCLFCLFFILSYHVMYTFALPRRDKEVKLFHASMRELRTQARLCHMLGTCGLRSLEPKPFPTLFLAVLFEVCVRVLQTFILREHVKHNKSRKCQISTREHVIIRLPLPRTLEMRCAKRLVWHWSVLYFC